MLLLWVNAENVLWMYFGFIAPALVFSLIVIPMWSKQDSIFGAISSHRVSVIQRYEVWRYISPTSCR